MVDEHISDRKIETEAGSLGFFIETIEYVLPRILRSEIDSKHMFRIDFRTYCPGNNAILYINTWIYI